MSIPSRKFKSSKAARNSESLAVNAYNLRMSRESDSEALSMQCQNNRILVQDRGKMLKNNCI